MAYGIRADWAWGRIAAFNRCLASPAWAALLVFVLGTTSVTRAVADDLEYRYGHGFVVGEMSAWSSTRGATCPTLKPVNDPGGFDACKDFGGDPTKSGDRVLTWHWDAQAQICQRKITYGTGSYPGCVWFPAPYPADEFVRARSQLEIALSGPSHTKALPAGPVLSQVARVLRNGQPAAGVGVSIQVIGAGDGSVTGITDGAGDFRFVYIPPYLVSTVDTLKGSRADCRNTATKIITVEACEVCSAPPR